MPTPSATTSPSATSLAWVGGRLRHGAGRQVTNTGQVQLNGLGVTDDGPGTPTVNCRSPGWYPQWP